LKGSWGGEVRNVSVLAAVCQEDREGWSGFLRYLKKRRLRGTQLFITDKCMGLVESLAEHLPDPRWQRCMVHTPSGEVVRSRFGVPHGGPLSPLLANVYLSAVDFWLSGRPGWGAPRG